MPVVSVTDVTGFNDSEVFSLIFPRFTPDGKWSWDEVRPMASAYSGFGIGPNCASDFPWEKLPASVLLPYLGRETELSSAFEADIFQRVLRGIFTVIRFHKMSVALPDGHKWRVRGPFIEAVQIEEKHDIEEPDPSTEVLQVLAALLYISSDQLVRAVSYYSLTCRCRS